MESLSVTGCLKQIREARATALARRDGPAVSLAARLQAEGALARAGGHRGACRMYVVTFIERLDTGAVQTTTIMKGDGQNGFGPAPPRHGGPRRLAIRVGNLP